MSNHTPGPWHVTAGHRSIRPSFISPGENGGFAICEMYADGRDFTANARLIAAAPQLLAVLEELSESAAYWSEYDVPIGIVDRINDAIATARSGRADGGGGA